MFPKLVNFYKRTFTYSEVVKPFCGLEFIFMIVET